ncbi:MAG TPA: DUF1553 domain-containing protein, partial [Verrucomicrobiae bacterium]|nr:DUF1553 domain-containing protein [Verrucomicrobiae bacterium]
GGANPRADTLGHREVWHFFDLADDRSGDTPAGSPLAEWIAAARAGDKARIDAAAQTFQAAFNTWKQDVKTDTPETRLYRKINDFRSPFWAATRGQPGNLSPETRGQLAALKTEMAELQTTLQTPFPVTHGFQEGGTPQSAYEGFKDSHVLIRGRYDRPGDIVPRGFPAVIAGTNPPAIGTGSGRLALAQWLTSPENPMLARVMANRVWQQHFGEGLVRTPNNFGKLGERPTHPELLDYLAHEFATKGWSVKAMHRAILLSATYQQSSVPDPKTRAADPENRLLGHAPRRRLEAEPLRDSLLALAGRLDETLGGPSIRDFDNTRRTLYLMTIRSDRGNYRMLFDAPDPVGIAERRNDSIVAPQALFLLNHPFMLAQTKAISDRALALPNAGDKARVQWLYQSLYGRAARPEEIQLGLGAVNGADEGREKRWMAYCQALLCANEFLYVD